MENHAGVRGPMTRNGCLEVGQATPLHHGGVIPHTSRRDFNVHPHSAKENHHGKTFNGEEELRT